MQLLGGGIDFQHGDVQGTGESDQFRRIGEVSSQAHRDAVGALHHVAVGNDVPLLAPDEPASRTLRDFKDVEAEQIPAQFVVGDEYGGGGGVLENLDVVLFIRGTELRYHHRLDGFLGRQGRSRIGFPAASRSEKEEDRAGQKKQGCRSFLSLGGHGVYCVRWITWPRGDAAVDLFSWDQSIFFPLSKFPGQWQLRGKLKNEYFSRNYNRRIY